MRRIWATALFLFACHRRGDPPRDADIAGDAAAELVTKPRVDLDTGPAATGPFCSDEIPAGGDAGAGRVFRTKHYELYAELEPAEAVNLARMLEASSAAFASWFARPAPDRRLKVKMFRDVAAWRAGLVADGITPMAAGGYYAPNTETAYMFRQPTYYFTRLLAIHEAVHQFHYLMRHPPSMRQWYVEGIAEYLSRHDWDGRCIRLGVRPLVDVDNPLAEAATTPRDLPEMLAEKLQGSRGEAWSIVRFLDTSPAFHEKFTAYREAFDAARHPSFAETVAAPESLVAPLTAWLETARAPFERVYTDWASVGPASVEVRTPNVLSMTLVGKQVTPHPSHLGLHARSTAPKWDIGAVVSYTDEHHYVVVLHASDGRVKTFTARGDNFWADIGSAPLAPDGNERITVDLEPGRARVTINGSALFVPVETPRLGLAANDGAVRFSDLELY